MKNFKSGIFSLILIAMTVHLWGCTKPQENFVDVPELVLNTIAETASKVPAPPEAEQPKAGILNPETDSGFVIYNIAPEQVSDYHPLVINNFTV